MWGVRLGAFGLESDDWKLGLVPGPWGFGMGLGLGALAWDLRFRACCLGLVCGPGVSDFGFASWAWA